MTLSTAARALVALVALASAAYANEDFDRTGPYVGAGLALGFEQFDLGQIDPETALGMDFWGGYRLHRFAAAEVQVQFLERFDFQLADGSRVETSALTFSGNLKAFVPLGRFQPFAVAGVGFTRIDVDAGLVLGHGDELDLSARFGGGLDWYLTREISFTTSASYVLTTGDIERFDYVTLVLGAQYRF